MRHFQKIAEGINIGPLMSALMRNSQLWDQNALRTKHPGTAHSQVSDIWVWFNDARPEATRDVINDREVIPYPAWHDLHPLKAIIFDLMRHVGAIRIGRVIITRLPPGKSITPHVDQGAPAEYYTRFQLAMQSAPGSVFHIGEEAVCFRPGEIWQIDNRTIHSVVNNSDDDRIVCIIDLRCE